MKTRLLAASVALVVAGASGAAFFHPDRTHTLIAAPTTRPSPTTTATTVPPTTTTAVPPTTPVTLPPTTAAPLRQATAPTPTTAIAPFASLRSDAPLVPGDPLVFRGFGAWIDVYDWSSEFTGGKPVVGPREVDRMADLGVQALYVQATKKNSPNDIVDRNLLVPIINRAHQRGMRVIAWYLPSLEDPALDLRKMTAMTSLDVEAIGVDIESRAVNDVAERNRRLVDLSVAFRQRVPQTPLAAIVMPAVVMEVINPNFWPGFPYRELAPVYDAWMPMSYWTSRKSDSPYRDAYRYTSENVDRLRAQLGRSDLPVHPVGGIGDVTSTQDVDGFYRAAAERGSLGGSIYDYRTTGDALWEHLRAFRSPT